MPFPASDIFFIAFLSVLELLFAAQFFKAYKRTQGEKPKLIDRYEGVCWLMLASGFLGILIWVVQGRPHELPATTFAFTAAAIVCYVFLILFRLEAAAEEALKKRKARSQKAKATAQTRAAAQAKAEKASARLQKAKRVEILVPEPPAKPGRKRRPE